ncbi:MAG: tyrosine-type recombinase/integrase [Nitrososphaeraceae archaeon]|nr:tyrosine-type recombinase/integrase [Nitrososphaeraceae archaeon]MBV9668681.1 tyrosine-type recombinase/integrase [Nitrososphaeraceae archaeon]
MSKSTAKEYLSRLNNFKDFIATEYNSHLSINDLIAKIKQGEEDPYDLLNLYAAYLRNCSISNLTLKQRVVTVKNFLEYCDVDLSPRKFKIKVKLPKVVRKNKESLSKEDVIEILNVCDNIRLRTYVMLLAASGMHAVEALSIRIKDLDFDSSPSKIFVRGEYTKTKTDRIAFLTGEVTQQLKSWLDFKYRTRRVCYRDKQNRKTVTEYRVPNKKDTDLVFAVYQDNKTTNPNFIYDDLGSSFAKTLDRMGKGTREDSASHRRRQITLHSFRRFVKTTISDLGYSDFSEYFIGHSGSTYWTKKESEKEEIFLKVEPYLTFLNIPQLERQGADIQSKVDELEELNQSLRNRDKMKDDAIAQLSDQLMALTVRMQEIERRQQPYQSE